ncbi:2-oxo acid dehydrogenase subunit E2 [Kineosporia rhizophila]|uniref:dihydrolipoamide acetyltransferase family protein n=1 Tax=Kineosporia TaxID=49184 RepID=UPI001E5F0E5F|nr:MULTISPECIES: dihydrolipoamide acetyltransferase family protein [Kineosporia]MCE0539586.1 2-oxo acid dehydrogenase subunit E2 [Kineosporia rhizophila]GLY16520.1 hypothetical protein Kisp01_35350 [Kineosporia sp. NBRC 101677]
MPDFLLPDLGEGLTEAEIVGWLVQVGDEVTIDQPVVEVETAKASVEVPVPFAGTVTVLHAEPGVMLPVGAPLISVAEKGADEALGRAGTEAGGDSGAHHRDHGSSGSSGGTVVEGSSIGWASGITGTEQANRAGQAAGVNRIGEADNADRIGEAEIGSMGGLREPGIEIAPPQPTSTGTDPGEGTGESVGGGTGAGEASGNVLIGYGTPATARTRRRRPIRTGWAAPGTRTPDLDGRLEPTLNEPGNQPGTEQRPGRKPERRLEPGQEPRPEPAPGHANSTVVRVISPLARRIAREAQLDLRLVTGSGPDGLIMRADIRRALEERGADARATSRSADLSEQGVRSGVGAPAEYAEPAAHSRSAAHSRPTADARATVDAGPVTDSQATTHSRPAADSQRALRSGPADPADDVLGFDRLPLTGVRRFAAEKFSRSRREIPEATIWVDADATPFLAARSALNSSAHNAAGSSQRSGGAPAHWASPAQPVSLVALLARFVVAGLRRFPELNATVEDGEIHRHHAVHLGFAAQTDRGLVVPVVRHADRLTTRELAAALQQKTAAARDGRITPADLTGGTFTVNNYGVFGTDGAAAIINHPEAAILGIGRIVDRPWVLEGQLAVRKVTQLTLSFDHRVCDGATAGGLLRFVADCVENPVTALGDL